MNRNEDGALVCVDGTGMLWASLALARLDEKIPAEHESFFASLLRRVFDLVVTAYADPHADEYMVHDLCVSELFRKGANFYRHSDSEFKLLYTIFAAFHAKVLSAGLDRIDEQLFTPNAMIDSIADLISQLIASKTSHMFVTLDQMTKSLTTKQLATELRDYAFTQADELSRVIETHFREQYRLMMPANSEVRADSLVEIMTLPLRAQIHAALTKPLQNMNPTAGAIVESDSGLAKMDLKVYHRHIVLLVRNAFAPPPLAVGGRLGRR
jgi:hypothetical protein